MIFIDSPSVGADVEVWKNHLNDLEKMSPKYQRDKSVISEIKRAQQIIKLMEEIDLEVDMQDFPKE